MTRYTHRVGRPPIRSAQHAGRIVAHVDAPRLARHNNWRRVLLPLAVAVVVIALAFAATRQAGV